MDFTYKKQKPDKHQPKASSLLVAEIGIHLQVIHTSLSQLRRIVICK